MQREPTCPAAVGQRRRSNAQAAHVLYHTGGAEGTERQQADAMRRDVQVLVSAPSSLDPHPGFCAACTLTQRVSTAARPSHKPWACRVADYFAQLNNKMGGDLKKIQVVGEYMVEIWKAVGMDMERVQFVSASEEINS